MNETEQQITPVQEPVQEDTGWEYEEEEAGTGGRNRKKIGIYIGEFVLGLAIFIAIIWFIGKQTDKQPEMDFVFTDQSGNTQTVPLNNTGPVNESEFSYLFGTGGASLETPLSGIVSTGEELPEELITTGTTATTFIPKDCITPWKTTVKHGDYTLAYQQRTDVPNICNVEKRMCTDGILNGSFVQGSCKEDIKYEYDKIIATSENQKEVNEYIQPSKNPPNYDAKFDEEGKLIQGSSSDDTITDWVNYDTQGSQASDGSTSQSQPQPNASCITPWGEAIAHGQFTKAYKEPETSKECEVELRFCVNGVLKGSYEYLHCSYSNINDTLLPTSDSSDSESSSDEGGGIWDVFTNFFGF